jgi:hypothetical protein
MYDWLTYKFKSNIAKTIRLAMNVQYSQIGFDA